MLATEVAVCSRGTSCLPVVNVNSELGGDGRFAKSTLDEDPGELVGSVLGTGGISSKTLLRDG